MTEPCENQASNDDYHHENSTEYTRGHLFPSGHAPDADTATSTFTLTNVVPMTNTFNSQIWTKVENELANLITSHCKDKKDISCYVLTGALPGQTKMKDRVNIPSVIWTAFCCDNLKDKKKHSRAFWIDNSDKNTTKEIEFQELGKFEKYLKNAFKQTKLFHSDCSRYDS